MNDSRFASLVADALARVASFPGCSHEQALCYACEDVVESTLPSRIGNRAESTQLVNSVCAAEDMDSPRVTTGRGQRTVASADLDLHELCLRRPTVTALTVVHELAHLSCRVDSHGVLFRDELVRLVRAHVGVEHAALLHGLYSACGLEVSPWAASARRHH